MYPGIPYFPFPSSTVQVAAGGITTAAFAPGALNEPAVAAGTFTAAKFAAAFLTAAKIDAGAFATDKFPDAFLTAAKIAAQALAGQIVRSPQAGTIAIPGGSSTADATVSAVNTSKYLLINLGETFNVAADNRMWAYLTLQSSTTVRATRNLTGATESTTVSYLLLEFM